MPTCFRLHLESRRGNYLVSTVVQPWASLQTTCHASCSSGGICEVENCLTQKNISLLSFPPSTFLKFREGEMSEAFGIRNCLFGYFASLCLTIFFLPVHSMFLSTLMCCFNTDVPRCLAALLVAV